MDIPTRKCKKCSEEKQIEEFPVEKNGRGASYRRKVCRSCRNRQMAVAAEKDVERLQSWRKNALKRAREGRADPKKRATFILYDTTKADKEYGRPNDLDIAYVESRISEGCAYCGASNIKMTLDRVDNSGGHTKDNVVPACIRCNYLRRDMPYEAWLEIVPGVKAAVEKGKFGKWIGGIGKHRFTEDEVGKG